VIYRPDHGDQPNNDAGKARRAMAAGYGGRAITANEIEHHLHNVWPRIAGRGVKPSLGHVGARGE